MWVKEVMVMVGKVRETVILYKVVFHRAQK